MDLDLNRHFGEVYGLGANHKYEQDGYYFDAQGMRVDINGNVITPKQKIAEARKKHEEAMEGQKRDLQKKIREFEKEELRFKQEEQAAIISAAAENLHLLEHPLSKYRSTESIKEALEVLEYPIDDSLEHKELAAALRAIFDYVE